MTATAAELITEVRTFITESKDAAAAGADVQLKPLEALVAKACKAVLDLPDPQKDMHREELEILAADLDTLAKALNLQHEQVKEQMNALDKRRHAGHAYAAGNALTAANSKDNREG